MFNKFIFIINAPRGGGVSISKLKEFRIILKFLSGHMNFFISIYLMKSQIIKKRKKLEN